MIISILMANYNHGIFLDNAISQILLQTYQNWELIVIDDASTDNSVEIINSFSKIDSRIKPIYLEKNAGALNAIRIAERNCAGQLIFGVAADDYIQDELFFENAILAFEKYPKISGFFSKTILVNGTNNQFLSEMGYSLIEGYISPTEFKELFFNNLIFIPGSSSIWRKSDFEKFGGYNDELGAQVDYFINHTLPMYGGVYFENKNVYKMRSFEDSFSKTQNNINTIKNFFKIIQIQSEYRLLYKINLSQIKKWFFLITNINISKNELLQLLKETNIPPITYKTLIQIYFTKTKIFYLRIYRKISKILEL
jgi:glycosyltransferase involved in cell wall biosynthesis